MKTKKEPEWGGNIFGPLSWLGENCIPQSLTHGKNELFIEQKGAG